MDAANGSRGIVARSETEALELLIGKLVLHNTTLTARIGRLTEELAEAQRQLAARDAPKEETVHGA